MCTIIAAFCCWGCCISAISAVVGSKIGFDGELWLGGVSGFGEVDMDEPREGKVGGVVSVRHTDIMFDMGFLGQMRVHAASDEKGVK